MVFVAYRFTVEIIRPVTYCIVKVIESLCSIFLVATLLLW